MNILIQNGRVVDPTQDIDETLDLLIEDGFIAKLGGGIKAPKHVETFDADGLVVSPGFIDLHSHADDGAGLIHVEFFARDDLVSRQKKPRQFRDPKLPQCSFNQSRVAYAICFNRCARAARWMPATALGGLAIQLAFSRR